MPVRSGIVDSGSDAQKNLAQILKKALPNSVILAARLDLKDSANSTPKVSTMQELKEDL